MARGLNKRRNKNSKKHLIFFGAMVSPSSWLLKFQSASIFPPKNQQMRGNCFCTFAQLSTLQVESILSLCSESSCSMGGRSILPGFLWRTWSSWWWLRRHHCALHFVTWRHLSWKARGWILLAQCWGLGTGQGNGTVGFKVQLHAPVFSS